MNIKTDYRSRVRCIGGIVVSVLLAISGILLAATCYRLYTTAEGQPFTYARIGAAFSKIAPVIWITLAAVVANAVIAILFPMEEKKRQTRRPDAAYALLARRANLSGLPDALEKPIQKERRLRRLLVIATAVLLAVGAALSLVYLLDPSHFTGITSAECTQEVLGAMLFCMAMLLPSVASYLVYLFVGTRSRAREMEYLKDAIKQSSMPAAQNGEKQAANFLEKNKTTITRVAQLGLLLAAVVLMVLGVSNGGMLDVLKKAAEICAECIGLG